MEYSPCFDRKQVFCVAGVIAFVLYLIFIVAVGAIGSY